jgi:hypothetical protein
MRHDTRGICLAVDRDWYQTKLIAQLFVPPGQLSTFCQNPFLLSIFMSGNANTCWHSCLRPVYISSPPCLLQCFPDLLAMKAKRCHFLFAMITYCFLHLLVLFNMTPWQHLDSTFTSPTPPICVPPDSLWFTGVYTEAIQPGIHEEAGKGSELHPVIIQHQSGLHVMFLWKIAAGNLVLNKFILPFVSSCH